MTIETAREHLKELISRPHEPGSMSHLERHQRIAGSLGKHAKSVWLGLEGFTAEEVGKAIGTQVPSITKG